MAFSEHLTFQPEFSHLQHSIIFAIIFARLVKLEIYHAPVPWDLNVQTVREPYIHCIPRVVMICQFIGGVGPFSMIGLIYNVRTRIEVLWHETLVSCTCTMYMA